mgnify:CR=1 FL=1
MEVVVTLPESVTQDDSDYENVILFKCTRSLYMGIHRYFELRLSVTKSNVCWHSGSNLLLLAKFHNMFARREIDSSISGQSEPGNGFVRLAYIECRYPFGTFSEQYIQLFIDSLPQWLMK